MRGADDDDDDDDYALWVMLLLLQDCSWLFFESLKVPPTAGCLLLMRQAWRCMAWLRVQPVCLMCGVRHGVCCVCNKTECMRLFLHIRL